MNQFYDWIAARGTARNDGETGFPQRVRPQ